MCSWLSFLQTTAKNWGKMIGYPDDDPMSLVHDRYLIAMKTEEGERKVSHVPKIMSTYTHYFIRHGGVVREKVVGGYYLGITRWILMASFLKICAGGYLKN